MLIAVEPHLQTGSLEMWLRRPGEEIGTGDVIGVVLTDDGAYELLHASEPGVVAELCIHVGERVAPGAELVRLFELADG
jgi:pyruvate/2-oxoglutarate dehydrogenase complex dihydrolipoamide acyltransferase (E2) component